MAADPVSGAIVASAVIGAVGSLIGGSQSAKAARRQAEMHNEAMHRKLGYDLDLWDMEAQKLTADRDWAIKEIQAKARNEGKTAAWRDASAVSRYNYDLSIRNREQESLNEQFKRSDLVYDRQITFNQLEATAASRDQLRKLGEIEAEVAFDTEEQILQSLINEGKVRAMGQTGRSVGKRQQATVYELGQKLAQLDQSLLGAEREAESAIDEIIRDRQSADLAAYAQKMLPPGTLPGPIVPFATPVTDWIYPRELEPFDFGPEPVLGNVMSPSAAAGRVWGTTISGIAQSIGSAVAASAG